eukprot:scaffold2815_cov113-Isochrysis_galbana.AAC.16
MEVCWIYFDHLSRRKGKLRSAIGKNLSASQKIAVEFSRSQTNIAVEFPVREVAISDELHNAQSNLNDLSRKK